MAAGVDGLALWTIGHGTVELERFIAHLRPPHIERIVDVRRFPGSRRHPQFGVACLSSALADAGIDYAHAVDLGGRRRAANDSVNVGLRNDAFRGYADWMVSDAFRAAFADLMRSSALRRTAIMCAETPWWKCHRRLIADAATLLHDATVTHIVSGKAGPHVLTAGVMIVEDRLVYAAPPKS
ncbi:MAG: DUF488 domain-containing protein [Candidatus Eremiobacteraeota bacterium]|nr:DUF488 domain-containing protein [Candidatus Eremiobacteraeota bacterium]